MPRNNLIKMSDHDVRQWYNDYCVDIPDQIDQNLDLVHSARQACLLRNTYKQVARDMMADEEGRIELEEKHPILGFDELLEYKIIHKALSETEALRSIVESSRTTNEIVNYRYGIRKERTQ